VTKIISNGPNRILDIKIIYFSLYAVACRQQIAVAQMQVAAVPTVARKNPRPICKWFLFLRFLSSQTGHE
jgi:hypothetical protein